MPSPLAHTIVSLSVYPAFKSDNRKHNFILLLFILFVSLLPDFDIIPGIFGGKLAEFHRIYTHTIAGLVFFLLILFVVLSRLKVQKKTILLLLFIIIYSLHLFLDMFIIGTNPVNGIGLPLLYPVSNVKFISPVRIFRFKIFYGGELYEDLFSIKNLFFLLEETVYSLILAAFIYKLTSLIRKKTSPKSIKINF